MDLAFRGKQVLEKVEEDALFVLTKQQGFEVLVTGVVLAAWTVPVHREASLLVS